MSDVIELSIEDRIKACETMAADLGATGKYIASVWTSLKNKWGKPGCGVQIAYKNDPGNIIASVTVGQKGFVNFQKLVDTLTTKQANELGDDVTYDEAFPVRPSPEYTKHLSQDDMNGGGRKSALLVKAGIISAED